MDYLDYNISDNLGIQTDPAIKSESPRDFRGFSFDFFCGPGYFTIIVTATFYIRDYFFSVIP